MVSIETFAIGLDFGTLSVRGVLMNAETGYIIGSHTYEYPHGVITETLPNQNIPLDDYWCLQHTDDYINGLKIIIQHLVKLGKKIGMTNDAIKSIGIDFTSCTVLPVDSFGQPLLKNEQYKHHPHAWVKLWKHHAAQEQADKINQLAEERDEAWLPYYGGKLSSEWLFPKLLQIFEEDKEIYQATDSFLEAGDWVVWQLTGNNVRSRACAGYKAMYQESLGGYPSTDFFGALHPDFSNVVEEKIGSNIVDVGSIAGYLTKDYADLLGLTEETAVAVNHIDAHVCVAATGVTEPNTMLNIIGTSSCDILLSDSNTLVPGAAGLVQNGAVPNTYAYETGQNSVGDIFEWFIEHQVPKKYFDEAASKNISIYTHLEELASHLTPGESGLMALDWWNGARTPYMDANLTGLLVGLTLQTKPEEIYRALIEATAFGKRLIIENFEKQDIPIHHLVFCGGLPHKNKLFNQIYANITKKTIYVSNELETGAKSAAIFSILGTQPDKTLTEITSKMSVDNYEEIYHPQKSQLDRYDELYAVYQQLATSFGEQQNVMNTLQQLKRK